MNRTLTHTVDKAAYEAVMEVLERYLEGLHQADSKAVCDLFHPAATYVCAVANDFQILTVATYRQVLAQRMPPAQRGDCRRERIVAMAIGADTMARATVQLSMLNRDYLDYLTLIKQANRWQIIAKVFHYTDHQKGV